MRYGSDLTRVLWLVRCVYSLRIDYKRKKGNWYCGWIGRSLKVRCLMLVLFVVGRNCTYVENLIKVCVNGGQN
jgi:hypothetical protein